MFTGNEQPVDFRDTNVAMAGRALTGVANSVDPTSAVTRGYVQQLFAGAAGQLGSNPHLILNPFVDGVQGGSQGPMGFQGDMGIHGAQGHRGCTGPAGNPGEQGCAGRRGYHTRYTNDHVVSQLEQTCVGAAALKVFKELKGKPL
jgi:hypothetical protein